MVFGLIDIETGNTRLTASGENAFIVRKGKKIKIPSAEAEAKLIEEVQKTRDPNKLDKFKKEYPKLIEGDTVICGNKTNITINTSYNKGKEKPVDDYKFRASKSVLMCPNSELKVSGLETWDKTDENARKRWHGELIKIIELKKGFFSITYSHTEDALITPVASIKFLFDGSGFFDVYDNILYSCTSKSLSVGAGGVEYTNNLTKKSFIAKSSTPEEIIVTRDGIYRKGMAQMDEVFKPVQLNLHFQKMAHQSVFSIAMDEKQMAEQYKNMPKTMEQGLAAVEMFKQMSPDDLARMMKMGEAHGAKITPEMMKQFKEIPEMIKAMEKEGHMKEMKQAMAMGKGMIEGLGDKGTELMAKAMASAPQNLKKALEKQEGEAKAAGIDIEKILESPRKYKPLTAEFGAVRVA